ncbi:outer membrane protein [Geomonas sp.]|uniref:outer membrane protein n=1 Tax=Geomonas sp. TaxID=2651584 RepID=UPI002B474B5D|nr:outer membrane beta-barrel protein [Geomonas sp.]HJV34213.1 outer membrane beta-barrel protein [Geomonas sp.]
MKKCLFVFLALATLALPSISMATQPDRGAYVSGFLGLTFPNDADVKSFNVNDKMEYDVGSYVGATGGYDFGWVRTEGELSYRRGNPSKVNDRLNGVTYDKLSDSGGLSIISMMGNAFVDIHNQSPFTPYLGGGLGFAAMTLNDTLGSTPTQRVIVFQGGDDTVFAWQLGAGVDYNITKMFSVDLGYRFFSTATAHFNKASLAEYDLKFQSHNLALALRLKF